MDLEKLKTQLKNFGQPEYRFRQIYQAIFRNFVEGFDEMTVLPKDLRKKLAESFKISSLKLVTLKESSDKKVKKALFELEDKKRIESVLILDHRRRTVCLSSQVGCPMGCRFCATGTKMGFARNLSSQEIYDQVLFWARFLKRKNLSITNVVFMGMGEPFLNYDNVMGAIKVLNDKNGLNLARRRISISTCGVIEGIKKFIKENLEVNLAISLHAPENNLRSKLMPINKKYPLEKLIDVCRDYVQRTRRKLFFEYVMLEGINDSLKQARQLARLLNHPLFHVNLIPYNFTGTSFRASSFKTICQFEKELRKLSLHCTRRKSLGGEIWAGCGQLKT